LAGRASRFKHGAIFFTGGMLFEEKWIPGLEKRIQSASQEVIKEEDVTMM